MSDPIVLAFDTSAAHCAAALLCGDRLWAERAVEMGRGQAEALFPMLEEMLADEGVGWADLGLLAVGTGPGNFTGVRISVSAARGLRLALGIPAIGITAFEAMRGAASFRDKRPALVSLSAPRGALYLQEFADGAATGAPQQVTPWVSPILLVNPDIAEVVGVEATEVAHYLSETGQCRAGLRGHSASLLGIGPVMARIARDKWHAGASGAERPAPVYVRPADAAPARAAPPVLLP